MVEKEENRKHLPKVQLKKRKSVNQGKISIPIGSLSTIRSNDITITPSHKYSMRLSLKRSLTDVAYVAKPHQRHVGNSISWWETRLNNA